MTIEMHAGLTSEGGSKFKMLISYVDNLPIGYKILIFCFVLLILFRGLNSGCCCGFAFSSFCCQSFLFCKF
uniref:Uncharacterized protein n=1 Tax=Nelumbo nucifera TaxID=4432 RepID=A0A822Z6K5_NELNU|nr:TPA_asm: hypothetical protein HUJ06_013342 [Nelumbo nucifera]